MAPNAEPSDLSKGQPDNRPPVGAHLAEILDGAARDLLADHDDENVVDTLHRIVAGAVACNPHVNRAGISYVGPDRTVTFEAP